MSKQEEIKELECLISFCIMNDEEAHDLARSIVLKYGYHKAPELEARIRELENVLTELRKWMKDLPKLHLYDSNKEIILRDLILDKMTELMGEQESGYATK